MTSRNPPEQINIFRQGAARGAVRAGDLREGEVGGADGALLQIPNQLRRLAEGILTTGHQTHKFLSNLIQADIVQFRCYMYATMVLYTCKQVHSRHK